MEINIVEGSSERKTQEGGSGGKLQADGQNGVEKEQQKGRKAGSVRGSHWGSGHSCGATCHSPGLMGH